MKKDSITIIGDKILEYPNKIGVRHLDRLKQACEDLNLSTEKNSELELSLFLATNNYIVISDYCSGLLFSLPEKLSEFQIDYLISQKEKFYEILSNDNIIEIAITTEKQQDYNKMFYRNLGIEQQIAGYEGRKIDSQLDILYDHVESQQLKQK